jgi:hypothetical protein
MQVANLYINGSRVITKHEPILGEDIKLSLDRDFTYSCIDTKMDIEVKFYCASGKTEIDLAYEENGIEAFGEIEIVDQCENQSQFFTFRLDFKSYKSNSEFTTLGITDINSDWKSTLTNEVNVNNLIGNPLDFYIRNLQLKYYYSSENVYASSDLDTMNTQHRNETHTIYPKVNTLINELEDSDGLLMNFFVVGGRKALPWPASYIDSASGVRTLSPPNSVPHPEIEPTPVFQNKSGSGIFTIQTINTETYIEFQDIGFVDTQFAYLAEWICVGEKFESPRYKILNVTSNSPAIPIVSTTPINITATYNKTFNDTFFVDDDENVWIWYEIIYTRNPTIPIPNDMDFKKISYTITNTVNANFQITKNTSNIISSSSDIEPYHSKTKAYKADNFLNVIFGTNYNLCQTNCFADLWFSRGDYIRNKVNVSDFIVRPSDFFSEFEKAICCGLGYFYFNNGMPAEKRLMTVYDFYTDIPVPSQYIFNYPDLIDAEIKIEPFISPYYKEIQIGYSNSKDTQNDLCKQNTYTIANRSESIYSKVSDFIASMFIITRALRLGTQDEELEYDKNIFILSGTTIPASPANYNVTLSQSSGFLADNVDLNPTNTNGINRRYATVFNLFRHLYKWGFSLFSNKDTLRVVKYEGSSIYDLEILDSSGVSTNPYYPGLSDCKLPALNFEKVDRTVDNMYSMIQSNMYVPSVLTFSTAKLSTFDLIAMRAFQYDLFEVSDGTNTYYGNLISANLVNDVTEIKLLRRFKNGI